ncbi:hypothetical protein BBJ28_00008873 [Nothophytophthora sp. Chile5]|nr:hypothetical protein BBJ28_00008873 [Nothophytophthora sp. Chile5]
MRAVASTISTAVAVFTVLLLRHFAVAHSWIECLDPNYSRVYTEAYEYAFGGPGGAGLCAGYSYNYPGRGSAAAAAITEGSAEDALLLVKILKDKFPQPATPLCKPNTAASRYTGQGYGKRLSVTPGTPVFFSYMPNGHVAKDESARGTLYGVYWTAQAGSQLSFTTDLTDKLLDGTRHNFDDGNCGQTLNMAGTPSGRAGDAFPCVGSFTIPVGTAPGVYSLVWGWKHWDEATGGLIVNAHGTYGGAYYGSCFDVEVD